MKSLTSLFPSDVTLESFFSGFSLDDPVTLIPSIGLFLLGLAFGGLLFRRGRRDGTPEAAVDEEKPVSADDTVSAGQNASVAMPDPAAARAVRDQATLEAELAASRLHGDNLGAEIRFLGERFSRLRQHWDEDRHRLGKILDSARHAASLPRHQAVLTRALLPVVQLNESMRAERQRIDGSLSQSERLESRLREEGDRFREAGASLARAREEVGGRLSDPAGAGPAMLALADRLTRTDEQLRGWEQNFGGCVARVVSAREHLQREQSRIRGAAQPIQEAEALLNAEPVGVAEVGAALAGARDRLTVAHDLISKLESGEDQELSETTRRVDSAVRDASSGFFIALDQHMDGEGGSDPAATLIESRVWRELGVLRGSLSSIGVTLETGAVAAPFEVCGKSLLLDAAARALAAIETAQSQPMAETEAAPESPDQTEAEIARLREEAGQREAEISSLKETIASLEERISRSLPAASAVGAADFETTVPGLASSEEGGRGSRQFIRRLLGLGPGRWEADLDASGRLVAIATPGAVATLAEARDVVTELRRVPVYQPESASASHKGRHHGLPLAASAPPAESEELAVEIRRLGFELGERDARIARLEEELESLRLDPSGRLDFFADPSPPENRSHFSPGGWGAGHLDSLGAGEAFALAGEAAQRPGDETEHTPESRESAAPALQTDLDALAAQSENRTDGLVLFRSNDPSLWRRDVYTGANRRSRSLDLLPAGLAYLRLRRTDTGEGIVAPVTNAQLLDDGDGLQRGFNGANEFFYGAFHLGVFDESLPQEFETRFTFGGWGFGHTVAGSECQASGWEGRPIPSRTVFEIAVFRCMPALGEKDRLLEETRN